MEQKSNGKIFCFKNKFLNFSETKKFSTEISLTFRELQSLVSYKRVSYKKLRVHYHKNVFILSKNHVGLINPKDEEEKCILVKDFEGNKC